VGTAGSTKRQTGDLAVVPASSELRQPSQEGSGIDPPALSGCSASSQGYRITCPPRRSLLCGPEDDVATCFGALLDVNLLESPARPVPLHDLLAGDATERC